MEVKSLGHKTSLELNRSSGEVKDHGNYLCIKTPSRPDFFWGNYLLLAQAPKKGDFFELVKLYRSHFGDPNKQGFITITWDLSDAKPSISEFQSNGFQLDTSKILVTDSVKPHSNMNNSIEIREYDPNQNIDQYLDVHYDPKWSYGTDEEQRSFMISSLRDFSSLPDNRQKKRIGAYINDKLVGDLGIFKVGNLIRFNNVSTHRDFRRLGVCRRLVFEASNLGLTNPGATKLVMEADANYHAAKIYESLGFQHRETIYSLQWLGAKFSNKNSDLP